MSWKLFGASNEPEASSSGLTESSALLQNKNNDDGDHVEDALHVPAQNLSNKGNEEPSVDDGNDEDVPTMSVELFFDLVVAGAINSLSDLLEVQIPDLNDWLWFVLRVYFVFNLWHGCLVLNGFWDLFGSKETAKTGIHVVTFGFIFLVVALVRTGQNDSNVASGLVYILGGAFVLLVGGIIARLGEKRPSISDENYSHFQKVTRLISILIPVECLPLAISIIFFRKTPHGILIGGYTTAIIFFTWRRVFARQIGDIPTYTHSQQHIADLNRFRERYEVITLAVLGVLCILNQSEKSSYYVAFCSIVTAMAAFLIYFRARVYGRTEPWLVSAESAVMFPNLHILIFCLIPSMGVVFNEIVVDQEQSIEWYIDPHVLLCCIGGLFLMILGCMDLLAEDQRDDDESKRPSLGQRYRVSIYFVAGMVLCGCSQFPIAYRHSEIVVPAVFAVIAKVQIWGTRPRRGG